MSEMVDMDVDERERRAAIAVEAYGGIVPYCETFYLRSIIYSAGRCLESFEHYEHVKTLDVAPDYIVSVIQEAVGHAAALSRYFWPSPGGRKKEPNQKKLKEHRGVKLCEAFGLNESSPLYNRDLRNAWEHFDERLDTYLLKAEAGYFFPTCIIDTHTLADDPVGHIFKLLDTEAECLVLMDIKYFFSPIREEVKNIFNHACKADKNGARLNVPSAAL